MNSPFIESPQPFRYNKALEKKIGKRTGAYVRKSNIPKDDDGLFNVDGYFENTTEKMSIATTDHETSMTSDILVGKNYSDVLNVQDASDTDGRSTPASSPNPISWRKRHMLQLSSQKDVELRDLMNGSQVPNTTGDFKEKSSLSKNQFASQKGISSFLSSDSKEPESALRGNYSEGKPSRSFISNVTYLTNPPSVSMSPDDDHTAKKDMEQLLKQNDVLSSYFQNLQGDRGIAKMRNDLQKINDVNSKSEKIDSDETYESDQQESEWPTISFLSSAKRHLEFKGDQEATKGGNAKTIKSNQNTEKHHDQKANTLGNKVTVRENKKEKPQGEALAKKNELTENKLNQNKSIENRPKISSDPQEHEIAIEERKLKEKLDRLALERTKDQAEKVKRSTEIEVSEKGKKEIEKSDPKDDEKSRKKKVEIPKRGRDIAQKAPSNQSSGNKRRSPVNQHKTNANDYKISPKEDRISHDFYENDGDVGMGDYGYGGDQDFGGQEVNQNISDSDSQKDFPINKNQKKETSNAILKPVGKKTSPNQEIEGKKDLKRLKKNESLVRKPKEKERSIQVKFRESKPRTKSKQMKEFEKRPRSRGNKKRKRDKFIEAYDRAIGANDLHLVEQEVKKTNETFAGGRYPKRLRLPKFCFWKNERPIYMNRGQGLEIVRILYEDGSQERIRAYNLRKSSSPFKGREKEIKKKTEFRSSDEKKSKKNMDKDEERRLESLDRMKFDYKVVSEDSQTITVFLKIKPQQEKDSQRNVAGEMKCTVIKCEDRKVEITCMDKVQVLSMNEKFIIPSKSIYSIRNKSKFKDLEISCHIMK